MSDEQETVGAGSETCGETGDATQVASTDTTTETVQTDTAVGAGVAADEPKHDGPEAGSPCICNDGRPGTIHRIGGETICLANQG